MSFKLKPSLSDCTSLKLRTLSHYKTPFIFLFITTFSKLESDLRFEFFSLVPQISSKPPVVPLITLRCVWTVSPAMQLQRNKMSKNWLKPPWRSAYLELKPTQLMFTSYPNLMAKKRLHTEHGRHSGSAQTGRAQWDAYFSKPKLFFLLACVWMLVKTPKYLECIMLFFSVVSSKKYLFYNIYMELDFGAFAMGEGGKSIMLRFKIMCDLFFIF